MTAETINGGDRAAGAQRSGAHTALRVIVFPGGANLPLWVAEANGYFAREGLAVTLTPTPNSVVLAQSLASGAQDIALSAFDNIVAYQEGQGEVALDDARFNTAPDFFAFMGFSRGTLRLVAQPQIRSVAELRGGTLAVDAVATGYSLALRKLLARAGLREDDYALESVGGTALRAQMLMQNKTPATMLTTPLEIAPESQGCRRLASVTEAIGPYQTIVGMARRSWAQAHRATLVAFIRASRAALEWLFDPAHRADAAAIYARHQPDVPGAAVERHLAELLGGREGFQRDGRLDHDGMRTVLAIRSEFGRPRKSLADPARYCDESYYAQSAAR